MRLRAFPSPGPTSPKFSLRLGGHPKYYGRSPRSCVSLSIVAKLDTFPDNFSVLDCVRMTLNKRRITYKRMG